jgi:hypothetical protein|tara:strand:- start:4402 stop:4794 length:393 start_codon:yes stop_codon:yes gene_type:complete
LKITDSNDNLLAIIIRNNEIHEGKNFQTVDEESFQLASFNLEKNTVIEKHFHPEQERIVNKTSEVLVVIEGEIEVEIFDNQLTFITSEVIYKGDTLGLFSGGHGLKLNKNSKFIEVKQGPYDPDTDKIRF